MPCNYSFLEQISTMGTGMEMEWNGMDKQTNNGNGQWTEMK